MPDPELTSEEADSAIEDSPHAAGRGFLIDRQRSGSVGVGPYAGLALLTADRGAVAHMIAGGVARVRLGFVQLGGNLEISDRVQDRWRLLGGFIGAFVPYKNWIDLEFAVGGGLRTYQNPDTRYGSGGYDLSTPVFSLRAGISDRLGEGVLGLRLGGELMLNVDATRPAVNWAYSYTDLTDATQVIRGSTRVGGTSVGIAISASLDVVPRGGG